MNLTVQPFRPHHKAPLTPSEVREAFRNAVRTDIAPEAVADSNRGRPLSLFLGGADRALLAQAEHRHPGYPTQRRLVEALALAWWRREGKSAAPATGNGQGGQELPAENSAASISAERDHAQTRMISAIMDAVGRNSIALVEGGTGIGKSRVIGRCATDAFLFDHR